jgi:hypothetical protein
MFQKALIYYQKAISLNQAFLIGQEGIKIKLCQKNSLEEKKFIPMKEDQLVEDILILIFEFLNQYDLKKISSTCSQFQKLSNDKKLWENFILSNDPKYYEFLKKEKKNINWKNIYKNNYQCGDIYFINQYSISSLATKYIPLEGRGIVDMKDGLYFSMKNQIFEIADYSQKTPAILAQFPETLDLENGESIRLGYVVSVDYSKRYTIIIFSSNIFYFKRGKSEHWKFDKKNPNYVVNFPEKIKKMSNGILLTKSGDVYLNETIKIASKVDNIFVRDDIVALIKDGCASIYKLEDYELKFLEEFKLEKIEKVDMNGYTYYFLSESGKVYVSNKQTLISGKLISETEDISYLLVKTESLGFVKDIQIHQGCLYLHTLNGILYVVGHGNHIGIGTSPIGNYPLTDTLGMFCPVKHPSSHPIMKVSFRASGVNLLIANPNSTFLLSDTPDEMLKCKFCGMNYRKDLNSFFSFLLTF